MSEIFKRVKTRRIQFNPNLFMLRWESSSLIIKEQTNDQAFWTFDFQRLLLVDAVVIDPPIWSWCIVIHLISICSYFIDSSQLSWKNSPGASVEVVYSWPTQYLSVAVKICWKAYGNYNIDHLHKSTYCTRDWAENFHIYWLSMSEHVF